MCGIPEITQFVFHCLHMRHIYVFHSYKNSGNAAQNSLNHFNFSFCCTHISPPVTFELIMSQGGLKGKVTDCALHYLSSSLYIITFSISSWWIQRRNMSKKGRDGVPWWFVFLKTPLLSFCFQSQFWFEHKWSHLGQSALASPVSLHHRQTWPSCTHFGSHRTALYPGPARILCSRGIYEHYMHMGSKEGLRTHMLCISPLLTCSIVPSDFTYKTQVQW